MDGARGPATGAGGEPCRSWRSSRSGGILLLTGGDGDGSGEDLTVEQASDGDGDQTPEPEPAQQADPVERLPDGEGLLYATMRNSIVRLDLATGERTERELPMASDGYVGAEGMVVTDEAVVFPRGQPPAVLALPRDLDGEPVELVAAASHRGNEPPPQVVGVFRAGGQAVTVVLAEFPLATEVRTIRVTDGEVLAVDRLPGGAQILHLGNRTAVVALAGEIFRHDLDAGEGERVAIGRPLGADREQVVYVRCRADLSCMLLRRRFGEESRDAVGAAPRSGLGASGARAASLSPDGRWLRILTVGEPSTELRDLDSGERRPLPPSMEESPTPGRVVAWTPNGSWLLQPRLSTIHAWRPEDGELVELDLGDSGIKGVAVSP